MGAKRKVTKKKVMVVDDDRDFLDEVREILDERGYETIMADNGDQALQSARSLRPDIILLDIVMSEMNGFQLADRLNKLKGTRRIPIIAMTGWFVREEHVRLLNMLGITAVLMKPVDPAEVAACIERTLENGKR